MPSPFARRLNALCARWEETHGERLTNYSLARQLTERGYSLSKPYLSQLRRGHRKQPSPQLVEGLAEFFEVDSDYFGEHPGPDGPENAILIHQISDADLRRLLTLADGLSSDSLEQLTKVAALLRLAEDSEVPLADPSP